MRISRPKFAKFKNISRINSGLGFWKGDFVLFCETFCFFALFRSQIKHSLKPAKRVGSLM